MVVIFDLDLESGDPMVNYIHYLYMIYIGWNEPRYNIYFCIYVLLKYQVFNISLLTKVIVEVAAQRRVFPYVLHL